MSAAVVLESISCKEPDCTLAQGGRCAREAEFANPARECTSLQRMTTKQPAYAPKVEAAATMTSASTGDEIAPWGGRHLNLEEADEIVRRSAARVISVLGPFDAGKTSLLASFFLQIANGQYDSFAYRFASSRTLYGFQDLVDRANRWTGKPGDKIVEHTAREGESQGRRFLHLGVRPADERDDRHIDMLLSDLAGESIATWTQRVDAEAKRRLGFIPRSDGFVVVADSAELMGSSGMKMDADIGRLIRRVVSAAGPRRGRGLSLVFSKFDRVIDEVDPPEEALRCDRNAWGELGELTDAIWAALEQAREAGFELGVFAVSAFPKPLKEGQPAGVMAPFAHVMKHADRRERWPRMEYGVPEDANAFQCMRRWRGRR